MRPLEGHPLDTVEIDAVFRLQDAAAPHGSGLRVGAHGDPAAFEVLGMIDAGSRMAPDGAVVEHPHRHDRQGDQRLAVELRHEIGGQRHLGDIESLLLDHAPEYLVRWRDIGKDGVEAGDRHHPGLQRPRMAVGAKGDLQFGQMIGQGRLPAG